MSTAGARRLFGWYQRQLSAAPLRTNITSTCIICVLGDGIAQRIERRAAGSVGHHVPAPLPAVPTGAAPAGATGESADAGRRRVTAPQAAQQQQQQLPPPGSLPPKEEAWGHDLARSLRMVGWGVTGGGVPVILWCAAYNTGAGAGPRRAGPALVRRSSRSSRLLLLRLANGRRARAHIHTPTAMRRVFPSCARVPSASSRYNQLDKVFPGTAWR